MKSHRPYHTKRFMVLVTSTLPEGDTIVHCKTSYQLDAKAMDPVSKFDPNFNLSIKFNAREKIIFKKSIPVRTEKTQMHAKNTKENSLQRDNRGNSMNAMSLCCIAQIVPH